MSPFAVAQATSVLQGKLNYEGKLVAAAVHTSGLLSTRLHYDYEGEGASRAVRVSATVAGESEPRDLLVKLADVKTANKMWQTQPDQQLSYAGARIWARRHAPEVMLGVYSPEDWPDPKPEPKPVQSVQSKPAPALQPTSLRDMRPKPMEPARPVPTRAEIDQILAGDDISALAPEPEPEPKPDRARLVADRLRERMATVMRRLETNGPDEANGLYNEIMANTGLQAEWAKIRDERPELDAEMQDVASETLNAIVEARALAADVPA